MKKRITIILGAVFILTLMISTATAVNISNTQLIKEKNSKNEENIENRNKNLQKEIYVDKNIRLTKTKLSILRKTVNKIEDQEYKLLTNEIIKVIEKKGVINSKDIKDILLNLDMTNTEIYSGIVSGKAGDSAIATGFPRLGFPGTAAVVFWIGVGTYVKWKAEKKSDGYVNLDVNGHHITTNHHGFAFIPAGTWYSRVYINYGRWIWDMAINIWSPLIFLTYD